MRHIARVLKIGSCAPKRVRTFLFSNFSSSKKQGGEEEPILDKIDLKSLQLYGFHGAGAHEKRRGQRFIVDATLFLPLGRPGKSDNLNHTVNYVSVLRDLEKIMNGPSVDLIEHLADLMCYRILQGYPLVQSIRISIKKPDAPLPFPTDSFDCVGVTMYRKREDFDRVPSSYDLDSDSDDDHDPQS